MTFTKDYIISKTRGRETSVQQMILQTIFITNDFLYRAFVSSRTVYKNPTKCT